MGIPVVVAIEHKDWALGGDYIALSSSEMYFSQPKGLSGMNSMSR